MLAIKGRARGEGAKKKDFRRRSGARRGVERHRENTKQAGGKMGERDGRERGDDEKLSATWKVRREKEKSEGIKRRDEREIQVARVPAVRKGRFV